MRSSSVFTFPSFVRSTVAAATLVTILATTAGAAPAPPRARARGEYREPVTKRLFAFTHSGVLSHPKP
ncbi:MAG TPA: hypothetical protein VGF48_01080 [Thermoanaerobaculia bacterium]|jgi:hypothetical protein